MVRKTKNRRILSEKKRNKKRVTKKRRGGNKKDWENGFWSEKPTIYATFRSGDICEYVISLNYYYLYEDESTPLEQEKEGEGKKKIKTKKVLSIFINSNSKGFPENINISKDCTLLKKKDILKELMKNESFLEKVEKGKEVIAKEIAEEQNIRDRFVDKRKETEGALQGKQDKFKEIKEHHEEKTSRGF